MPDAPKRIFVKGNEAICHGALAAKCKCYFGYPITPQNDIPEMMSRALVQAGGEFVQAESEIGAANMLLGAATAGVRAMTSSSSPGISLKQEAISYMAGSHLPGVIVNISRGGPGLGSLGPSQGDYYQATRGGGHGDYHTPVLAPATCQEAYDLTIKAFDLAFSYRTPVMVLGDAILGQMKEPITPWLPEYTPNDRATDWCLTGNNGREKRLIKSLFLEDGTLASQHYDLMQKYKAMEKDVLFEAYGIEDATLVVCAYGSIGRVVKSTVRKLRAKGLKVGLFRPVTLFPFPHAVLKKLALEKKQFLTIEHNCGQMVDDVRLAIRTITDSSFYGIMPGELPNPEDFEKPIMETLGA